MRYFLFRHIDLVKISACGVAILNPGWVHMKRKLENESVLIFGRKNCAKINIDGEDVEICAGRMVILPAARFHFGSETIKMAASYYWIHFFASFEGEDEKRYFLPKEIEEDEALTVLSSAQVAYERLCDGIILPLFLDVKNIAQISNIFSQILQEKENPGFSPLKLKFLFQDLLLELAAECFRKMRPCANENEARNIVQKTLVVLQDELSNKNVSVKYLASKLNVNADYLGRCFKDALKISIGKYIEQKRIALACTRLRETSQSIEEILDECGFSSRRQFYDAFKSATGKTPASYRALSSAVGINLL